MRIITQTATQIEFAQALAKLMAEQGHGLEASALNLFNGDTLIFEGLEGIRNNDVVHIGGGGVHTESAGEVALTLRFKLTRSGSEEPTKLYVERPRSHERLIGALKPTLEEGEPDVVEAEVVEDE